MVAAVRCDWNLIWDSYVRECVCVSGDQRENLTELQSSKGVWSKSF